jgi:hypothetical protein
LSKRPPDACALDLYDELARDRVFEVLEREENGQALEALVRIARQCRRSERDIAAFVADLCTKREIYKQRAARKRAKARIRRDRFVRQAALAPDDLIADVLRVIGLRVERDRREALLNRLAFSYQTSPPNNDDLAALDRVRTYFQTRHLFRAKERAFTEPALKMTPERAAVGWIAAKIEKLAGAPLEADVLELIAPFLEKPINDRDALGRCRRAFKGAL